MSDEVAKKIIDVPSIPSTVQGDGRYVMSLLKAYLAQATEQINLANGFTADEINPDSDGDVPTPKNFSLTFNRYGAELTWDYPTDISKLKCYELRVNTDVGNNTGLLERTINNTSTQMPPQYVGTLYLYAISADDEYSNASILNYNKARPEAPTDIALTKNQEGTLITFLEIPYNCIGASIYVNGVKKAQTIDNIYLYKHQTNEIIKTVSVAYYDCFGDGEKGMINCIIPDITGFIAERNGANLDFYWDALNIYGVKYVVKVGQTTDWDKSIDLFTTKINKHRLAYPNTGQYYLLIKAADEHNNYSQNTAYFFMDNAGDSSKNVILDFKQADISYSGNKINLYYDAASEGLKLEKYATVGEYIASVELPQKYSARNWSEYKVIGTTNSNLLWIDMDFPIDSDRARNTLVLGGVMGDINGTTVRQQIARYIGPNTSEIFGVELNNSLKTSDGNEPKVANNATDFRTSRWAQGIYIGDTTQVEYELPDTMPQQFNMVFWLKKIQELNDCVLLTLRNGVFFLCIGFDSRCSCFYMTDNFGNRTDISLIVSEREWLMFGLSQGPTNRKLFIYSESSQKTESMEQALPPLGVFNKLYLYPKIILQGS